MKTTQCFAFALALLICAPALADTYAYRSIGAQGEVMFSDIPSASSTTIELKEVASAGPSSAQQVHLMLMVAAALAEARVARETERQARRQWAAKVELERERIDAYRLQHLQTLSAAATWRYGSPVFPGRHFPAHFARRHVADSPRHGHRGHPSAKPAREPAAHGHPPRTTRSVKFILPR